MLNTNLVFSVFSIPFGRYLLIQKAQCVTSRTHRLNEISVMEQNPCCEANARPGVKKFGNFYGDGSFITVITKVHNSSLSLAR